VITKTEADLVSLVTDADAKVRRGTTRILEIDEEIIHLQESARRESEARGKAQAEAALAGTAPPDAKAARGSIDTHRRTIAERQLERAEIQQQVDDLEVATRPLRERLTTLRRRRAVEASGDYLQSQLDDVLSLLPGLAASLAVSSSENIDFFASADRVCMALQKRVTDRARFREQCLQAHADLLTLLKLT